MSNGCGIHASDGDTLAKLGTPKPVAVTFLVQSDLLLETPPAAWQEFRVE